MHDTVSSWLEARFGASREVAFIQAGAFDGIAGDPLRPLVATHSGWRGALVEPMTGAFEQLRANYAFATDRLEFFNCAVSNRSGTIDMYAIPEHEIVARDLPPWSREIASVDRSHVTKHFPGAPVSRHSVPAMRLTEIAKKSGYTKVDLIVLDVEGYELDIIGDIDFDSLAVRALVFEHKHIGEQSYQALFIASERTALRFASMVATRLGIGEMSRADPARRGCHGGRRSLGIPR
jgi:FkbM family methyltransferase